MEQVRKHIKFFMEEADKCNPPLPDEVLASIWQSACRFAEKVQSQEGYVSPEDYNDEFCQESLKPADYSDIDKPRCWRKSMGWNCRITAATDYIRFCGAYWVESKQQASVLRRNFWICSLQMQRMMFGGQDGHFWM